MWQPIGWLLFYTSSEGTFYVHGWILQLIKCGLLVNNISSNNEAGEEPHMWECLDTNLLLGPALWSHTGCGWARHCLWCSKYAFSNGIHMIELCHIWNLGCHVTHGHLNMAALLAKDPNDFSAKWRCRKPAITTVQTRLHSSQHTYSTKHPEQ